MPEHDIHERGTGLFAPETMLASQYFDRIRRRSDVTGEQRLMCAVIEDAVDLFLKHAAARLPHHQEAFADAERWIETEDRSWLYSFDSICDYLGLDGDYIRRGLRAWKARARSAASPAAPAETHPVDAAERRRAMNE